MLYKAVGNAVAQWEEDSPLRWTMREPVRKGGHKSDPIECDLSVLVPAYSVTFLLALKDALISMRHRVQLITIGNRADEFRLLLQRVYSKGFDGNTVVQRIDSAFLVALNTLADEIPVQPIKNMKSFHARHMHDDRIFEAGLQPNDFPVKRSKRGARGDRIHRILAKALSRATLVHVLDVMETAYEQGEIDLARYAFTRLALNIFCRPESYRLLTLGDLREDKDPQSGAVSYFLDVVPAKNKAHNPRKITYGLHAEVGLLLAMQRQSVVSLFGHLAPTTESGPALNQLALFPALRLRADRSWMSAYANANEGALDTNGFRRAYIHPVKSLTRTPLSSNALRHTVGTQLAMMGCSAHTIQAVLKHAAATTCEAYVDIVFEGMIDTLSDALRPGFEEHFPVISAFTSRSDLIPVERRIVSEDMETGRIEITAACGRQVACAYAPIVCYSCPRFIPCYDADHTINLDVVEREISASDGRGLAMQHDVKRWKSIRNSIRIVIAACDNKRRAVEMSASG